jgi:importin subunit beta-1
MVRDTTAWTLAKIAENHAKCLTTGEGVFETVVNSWIASLDDEPRVAHNVCFAIRSLAVAAGDNDGNMLTPIFMKVMEKLVETSNRDDWQESNLRVEAYEAINKMVENCADDSLEVVAQIMPLIIGRLEAAVGMQVNTSDDKENRDSLINNLLGALQINIVRLDNDGPLEEKAFAGEVDKIMTLVLGSMQGAGAASNMEAIMVVGALINATGSGTSHS